MSSSANQPVCVGSSDERSDPRTHMNAEPGGAEQVLHRSARDDVGSERPHVELERADGLVAVGQDDRRRARDRARAIAVTSFRCPERKETAVQQTSAVRSSIASAKRSSGMRPSASGTDVDDLGAPQLLRVRDLTDRGELVLADDDAVALAREVERRHERADPL